MDFKDLIYKRQASRKYIDKPVEKEKLEQIADMAHFAPSACNSQPWKMHIVTGSMAEKIGGCLRDCGMNLWTKKVSSYIVVSEIKAKLTIGAGLKYDKNHFVKYDIGELVAYITLSAEELGISSCIIGWLNNKKIGELLNFEDDEECNVVVALGYSDDPLRTKKRNAIEKVTIWHE